MYARNLLASKSFLTSLLSWLEKYITGQKYIQYHAFAATFHCNWSLIRSRSIIQQRLLRVWKENTREGGYQKVCFGYLMVIINWDLSQTINLILEILKTQELKWSIAVSSRVKYGKLYFGLKYSSYLTKTIAHL